MSTTAEFNVPLAMRELEDQSRDGALYSVSEPPSLDCHDTATLHKHLDDVCGRVLARRTGGVEQLSEHENFDMLYAFVCKFPTLPGEIQARLLDTLEAAVKAAVVPFKAAAGRGASVALDESTPEQARLRSNALKMAACLLQNAMSSAESAHVAAKAAGNDAAASGKKGGRGRKKKDEDDDEENERFEWTARREAAVAALALALEVDMSKLWTMGVPDENFVTLFCRIAHQMLEQPIPKSSKNLRVSLLKLIAIPFKTVSGVETQVVASLLDLLNSQEHAPAVVAELCALLGSEKFGRDNRLGMTLMREVGRVDLSSQAVQNGPGLKNLSTFVVDLAGSMPSVMIQHMSVLLPLLDAEPYVLRSAVASAVGQLVTEARPDLSTADDDEEEGVSNKTNFERNRDGLLDVLMERAYDVNSYTRGAVLKAWTGIVEKGCLPLSRTHQVAMLAVDRLQDKSVLVRKAGMHLLVTLVEYNPFMGSLDPSMYETKNAELEQWFVDNPAPIQKAAAAAAAAAVEASANGGGADADNVAAVENADEKDGNESESENDAEDDEGEEDVAELEEEEEEEMANLRANMVRELDFHRSALAFIRVVEGASVRLQELSQSKTASDVVEALRFVVKGKHFGLPSADQALRSSLTLVWSSEASVRDEVVATFLDVYVLDPAAGVEQQDDDEEEEAAGGGRRSKTAAYPPSKVAANLMGAAMSASASEEACLEEIFHILLSPVGKDDSGSVKRSKSLLSPAVFGALRKVAMEGNRKAQRAAMQVIALALGGGAGHSATHKPSVSEADAAAARLSQLVLGPKRNASALFDTVLAAGCGETGEGSDWALVRSTALALQRIPKMSVEGAGSPGTDTMTLRRLEAVVRGEGCGAKAEATSDDETSQAGEVLKDTAAWFPAGEQALLALFRLAPNPEQLCGALLKSLESALFTQTVAEKSMSPTMTSATTEAKLARFCYVLGDVALRLLVYTEQKGTELKSAIVAAKDAKERAREAKRGEDEEDDNVEHELGLAAEADAELDARLAEVIDQEIVGRNLLSVFEPVLVRVVANESGHFNGRLLQEAATLALCKYMCISAQTCDRHLQLLFTKLQDHPLASVRANLMVALGDLAFRFPNLIEPWTEHLYARLKDNHKQVRGQTLLVLTHLILNDMIKVKGQISEIAICLEDEEPKTADLARLFFQELSKRGNNPIYNLMPDIVSRLSSMGLPREQFKRVMGFLMNFVTKDKQTESLVEKLCLRFSLCQGLEQQRQVAFCLSQLPINDKCVRKLDALSKHYTDALFDDEVFASFNMVVNKAKKNAANNKTPEAKDAVMEWAMKVTACHSGEAAVGKTPGEEDEATDATAGDTSGDDGATPICSEGGEGAEKEDEREDGKDEEEEEAKGFEVGDRIECRHDGGDDYFPGVIKKVRKDGTYDIDYDDGDKEKSVEYSLIKKEEAGEEEEEAEVTLEKGRGKTNKGGKAGKENAQAASKSKAKAKGKGKVTSADKAVTKAKGGRARAKA